MSSNVTNKAQLIEERVKQFRENADFVSTLFDHLTQYGILVSDFDGNIMAFNKGASIIYGYQPSEIIGKESIELFLPEDLVNTGILQKLLNERLDEGEFSSEWEMVRSSGESFDSNLSLLLTKDKSGNSIGFIIIVEDLTRRKTFEEGHKQLQKMGEEGERSLERMQGGSVTAKIAGMGSIKERYPGFYAELLKEYGILLDDYMEHLVFNKIIQRRRIIEFSNSVGDLAGGPRDVVEIHMDSIEEKCKDVNPMRIKAYTLQGRLLTLEIMGNLVDYYRLSNLSGSWD